MEPTNKKLIAVFGATGQQGGGVVRALQASSEFKVRALARDPDKHRQLAEEVVKGIWTTRITPKLHSKAHLASFWSPTFGKQVLESSAGHGGCTPLPKMPASNTLSGLRCPM